MANNRSESTSKRTIDHKAIRTWTEARDGHPVRITWDEFFSTFDGDELASLYQEKTSDEEEEENAEEAEGVEGDDEDEDDEVDLSDVDVDKEVTKGAPEDEELEDAEEDADEEDEDEGDAKE